MRLARVLGLSIALGLTIGAPAQPPKSGEQASGEQAKAAPRKQPAKPEPVAVNPPGPFDSLTEFSATMIGSLAGNEGQETKVYRSGKLMRVDSWNGINFFITNLSTNETSALLRRPQLKTERCVHEGGLLLQSFPFGFFRAGYKFQRTPAGEEDVDGHHCHIESVVRTDSSGNEIHVKFWEADDLNGFPVKIEVARARNTITVAYKDVKLGPPDPAVFKLPANCMAGPGVSSGAK